MEAKSSTNEIQRLLRLSVVFVLLLVLAGLFRTGVFFGNPVYGKTYTLVPADTTADAVFGQPDFSTGTADKNGLSAGSLESPTGIAIDSSGRLYISDQDNNRVLIFENPGGGDTTADTVLGQPDFSTSGANQNGLSASSLSAPQGLSFDTRNRLYVADYSNNRVLIYDNPAENDTVADTVLGQPSFDSNGVNQNGLSAASMFRPSEIAFDSRGRLFLTDFGNNRLLVFDDPTNGDTIADTVLGQPDFSTSGINQNGLSANSLYSPYGVIFDDRGRLYLSDRLNHRVLIYDDPTNGDTAADTVIGQPGFTTNSPFNASNNISSETTVAHPVGMALDANRRLFVVLEAKSLVVAFDDPASGDTTIDLVFGQPDATTGSVNNGGTTAASINQAQDVAIDSAGRLYISDYSNNRVLRFDPLTSEGSLAVARVVAPAGTSVIVNFPRDSIDSFVQIVLTGGETTSGSLSSAADSSGSNPDYVETSTLLNSYDSIAVSIWTSQNDLILYAAIRTDTESLDGNALPAGIPNSAKGKTTFAATVILLEFGNKSDSIIGDSKTTTNIADTNAYWLEYNLSETTALAFHEMGIDTTPGANSFRFYYADTFGGNWVEDTTVKVIVEDAAPPFSLRVRVAGITKDLPGGLGGAGSAVLPAAAKSNCIIRTAGMGAPAWSFLRRSRDLLLESRLGGFLVGIYYDLSRVFGLGAVSSTERPG